MEIPSPALKHVKDFNDAFNKPSGQPQGIYLSNAQLKNISEQLETDPALIGVKVNGLAFLIGEFEASKFCVEVIPYTVMNGERCFIETMDVIGWLHLNVGAPNDGGISKDGTPDNQILIIDNSCSTGGGGVSQTYPPPGEIVGGG